MTRDVKITFEVINYHLHKTSLLNIRNNNTYCGLIIAAL